MIDLVYSRTPLMALGLRYGCQKWDRDSSPLFQEPGIELLIRVARSKEPAEGALQSEQSSSIAGTFVPATPQNALVWPC